MNVIPDPFQVRVAQIALAVADRWGFALGGGHALLAHGLVRRPTEDVDLFTDVDGGVRTAIGLVQQALREAGLSAQPPSDGSALVALFDGMDDAFEELDVRDRRNSVRISLGRLPRQRAPIVMSVGPVLHLDDVLGSKLCAMVIRGEIRDYVDVGAALGRGYDRQRLFDLAHRHDPELSDDEVAAAMRRLDALPDESFSHYGLDASAVAEMRGRFATWER